MTRRVAMAGKEDAMNKEDRYLLLVIGFIIGWIVLMGLGVMG
jgi:hypothetical protein